MDKVNTIVLYTDSDKDYQEKFKNSVVMISKTVADITYINIDNITAEETKSLLSSDTKLVILLYSPELNAKLDEIANIMPELQIQHENKIKRFVVVKLVPCDNSGYFIDKLTTIPNVPNGEKCIGYPNNATMWYEVAVKLRLVYNSILNIS